MATGNNRKENTFRKKDQPDGTLIETIPTFIEEDVNEAKEKKKKREKPKQDKSNKPKKEKKESDGRLKRTLGILFLCLAIFLGIAFISYLISFYSGHHQELGNQIFNKDVQVDTTTGSAGVFFARTLIKESFGIGAFFFVYLLTIIGLWLLSDRKPKPWSIWKYALMSLVWLPLFFAYIPAPKCAILGGAVGKWLNENLSQYVGNLGVAIILVFLFLVFAIYQFNLTFKWFKEWRERRAERKAQQQAIVEAHDEGFRREDLDPDDDRDEDAHDDTGLSPVTSYTRDPDLEINGLENQADAPKENIIIRPTENDSQEQPVVTTISDDTNNDNVELVIEETPQEETVEHGKDKEHHGLDTLFDPRYELRNYKFPTLDMLNDYGGAKGEIDEAELNANKNKIVETLRNYGIEIEKIKATIGPTVTLYEIVPAAGVRISKIKNLEDDIALSLAALGIRIIAPIPGKGTIGIEVPNSKPETVSMRSVLSSEKFQNSKYALPCAIGKTISNETYVFDLAKMPHILMAGATGQGKSVGLNAIIASLLYSKHPSELKFVMVDPKKVELTLYNRIERHYLAKLPDTEDAIITDVKQVVRTLNSLCIEMDQRYDLLKAAECRNIIEYNEKFKSRRLLPTEGHRFLPYIVLVVDEFADLIMTAGRDVEAPIARLAQLARAIGIHLIIATQRPSVNIITGSIKANFPARIAFRVISQVDSKTILDQSGANQLIGRGDMLLSTGNDLVRLQCAFIDTPEVEAVTDFIGNQRGYSEPFLLPEVPEEEGEGADFEDDGERDSLFEEAARIVVQTQQGSTSMIQRKLKLGYNRAGRIIDQLEAAGIVGPFSGSKSREVKVSSETALEQILRDIYNKDNGI